MQPVQRISITMQNFVKNWSILCEAIATFDFLKWGPSDIIDLFGVYMNHPQTVFFVILQNLVVIDAVNMKVSTVGAFVFFWGGDLTP